MAKPSPEETTVEGDVFRAIREGTTPVETPPDERTRVTVEEIQRLRAHAGARRGAAHRACRPGSFGVHGGRIQIKN